MHTLKLTLAAMLVLFLGCIHIPAFPRVISLERCGQVAKDRLFNDASFSPSASKGELCIIRDVGSIGESEFVTVMIDAMRFAEMGVWESAPAFLSPGTHTIQVACPKGVIASGKHPNNILQIEIIENARTIVRIDFGRSNPPIHQAKQ